MLKLRGKLVSNTTNIIILQDLLTCWNEQVEKLSLLNQVKLISRKVTDHPIYCQDAELWEFVTIILFESVSS